MSTFTFKFQTLDNILVDTLFSVFIEVIHNSYNVRTDNHDISRITLQRLLKSLQETAFLKAFRTIDVEKKLFEQINNVLLDRKIDTNYYVYYDIDDATLYRVERINLIYKHETRALYNLDAYINQYIDYYSMI